MVLGFHRLIVTLTIVALSEALISRHFESVSHLNDKLYIADPLKATETDSLISCAMLCGEGCIVFSFNHETMKCRLYSSVWSSTTNITGWNTYMYEMGK